MCHTNKGPSYHSIFPKKIRQLFWPILLGFYYFSKNSIDILIGCFDYPISLWFVGRGLVVLNVVFINQILKFTFELCAIIRNYLIRYPILKNYILIDKTGRLFCPHCLIRLNLYPLGELIISHYNKLVLVRCNRCDPPNCINSPQKKAKVKTNSATHLAVHGLNSCESSTHGIW